MTREADVKKLKDELTAIKKEIDNAFKQGMPSDEDADKIGQRINDFINSNEDCYKDYTHREYYDFRKKAAVLENSFYKKFLDKKVALLRDEIIHASHVEPISKEKSKDFYDKIEKLRILNNEKLGDDAYELSIKVETNITELNSLVELGQTKKIRRLNNKYLYGGAIGLLAIVGAFIGTYKLIDWTGEKIKQASASLQQSQSKKTEENAKTAESKNEAKKEEAKQIDIADLKMENWPKFKMPENPSPAKPELYWQAPRNDIKRMIIASFIDRNAEMHAYNQGNQVAMNEAGQRRLEKVRLLKQIARETIMKDKDGKSPYLEMQKRLTPDKNGIFNHQNIENEAENLLKDLEGKYKIKYQDSISLTQTKFGILIQANKNQKA